MMDIERAKSTVLEVFEDVAGLVSFPVSWEFRTVDGGDMGGTLYINGLDFDLSFTFRATPGKAVAAHVLNLRVAAVASDLFGTIDVEDMWESWGAPLMSRPGVHSVHNTDNVLSNLAGAIEADVEAYESLLTVAYVLGLLENWYRTA